MKEKRERERERRNGGWPLSETKKKRKEKEPKPLDFTMPSGGGFHTPKMCTRVCVWVCVSVWVCRLRLKSDSGSFRLIPADSGSRSDAFRRRAVQNAPIPMIIIIIIIIIIIKNRTRMATNQWPSPSSSSPLPMSFHVATGKRRALNWDSRYEMLFIWRAHFEFNGW